MGGDNIGIVASRNHDSEGSLARTPIEFPMKKLVASPCFVQEVKAKKAAARASIVLMAIKDERENWEKKCHQTKNKELNLPPIDDELDATWGQAKDEDMTHSAFVTGLRDAVEENREYGQKEILESSGNAQGAGLEPTCTIIDELIAPSTYVHELRTALAQARVAKVSVALEDGLEQWERCDKLINA